MGSAYLLVGIARLNWPCRGGRLSGGSIEASYPTIGWASRLSDRLCHSRLYLLLCRVILVYNLSASRSWRRNCTARSPFFELEQPTPEMQESPPALPFSLFSAASRGQHYQTYTPCTSSMSKELDRISSNGQTVRSLPSDHHKRHPNANTYRAI